MKTNVLFRHAIGRWVLLVVMAAAALTAQAAEAYITEIIAIGAKKGKGNALKNSYREQGWTVLDKDLNAGAGGWDVYIAYKTSSDANPETDYITDIFVSTKWDDNMTFEGRRYYHAPTNSGFNGDLNRSAGGAYIWVYYTRERTGLTGCGGTKRVMTKLSTTSSSDDGLQATGVVCFRNGDYNNSAADMNKSAEGDDIFIQQHFATQKLSVSTPPQAAENVVFDGTYKNLVPNNPSGNWGTMKYRVGTSGAFSSSLPRAVAVGTYTVEYYLDGGNFAESSATGSINVTVNPPTCKAANFDAVFNQADKKVHLAWKAANVPGGYSDYKWVIYRGNTKIAALNYNEHTFSDSNYRNEQEETYTIYYVANPWGVDTKKDEAAVSRTVNCTRTVPVNNFSAESHTDYIELSWTSDGYPEGFGNKFNIYVDNEASPIYTITPGDYQTSFVWQHRRTQSEITNRQNGTDPETKIPYTEEPLNACNPHNYRVEGVIGTTKLNEASTENKSIGEGTLFYSLDAEKGVYPGVVKLSWHVNKQGSTDSKTYIIDRRLAEKADDLWTTIHRMSSVEEYLMYTDETPLPGVYYDYRVTVQDKCSDGTVVQSEITDIGFAHTTGTISGRITYGSTGTAVAGADVVAFKNESVGADDAQYRSMHFTNEYGTILWQYPNDSYQNDKFSAADFSVQFWMYPEEIKSKGILYLADNTFFAFDADGNLCFAAADDESNQIHKYTFTGLSPQTEKYSFITFTRTGNTLTAYLLTVDELGAVAVQKSEQTLAGNMLLKAVPFIPFGPLSQTNAFFRFGFFKGYVDELRLWTKCLTEQEILDNFDHLLVGNEKNLETYWTFDEGLRYQFFDYSRDGTFYHQHHGKVGNNAASSTLTPSALSLKAKTDKDGNYIIQGVSFSGEGATYSVVPAMGIHNFNPSQQLRYVGNNSLVHNNVNFEDVSSFRVRGVAYYENTTIPVQEAFLYVDGLIASKDGEAVKTNDYGEFEISVPIGDHFISIKKDGHTFLNGGRYPADPDGVGVRMTFDREISGLTFYDRTKVTVVGRVVGGDIEDEKPLGLGLSQANIGRAKLELRLSNENGYLSAVTPDPSNTAVSYDINPDTMRYEASAGNAYVPGGKNYIVVETDPLTGEWVAKLPPLKYDVTNITFPSRPENDAITKDDFSLPVIDANQTSELYADSVQEDNGEWRKIKYAASAKMKYKAQSDIDVTEGNDGTFGMRTYSITDRYGQTHEIQLYKLDETGAIDLDENGQVQYTLGYPVYEELAPVTYKLHAYERYVNYDGSVPVVNEVPLANKNVTVKNQYATTTAVSTKTDSTELGEKFMVMDEELTLDENGEALYRFQVGFPNILPPFTRGLSVSYDNNGTEMGWSGNGTFRVIVLGAVPTGNNFVTKGPDKILSVLRDPPGSNSSTTWTKGSSTTTKSTTTYQYNTEDGAAVTIKTGLQIEQAAGAPGMMLISSFKSKFDFTVGANYIGQHINSNTDITTITATRDISTSSSPEFTGAEGDVFIGASQNMIFGMCYGVSIVMKDNVPTLVRDTAVAVGEEFDTFFSYDQYYIRGTLLPNYRMLRNALLEHVDNINAVPRPAPGAEPIYLTTLTPDDPRFGTSNNDASVWGDAAVPISQMTDGRYDGPSYTILLPENHGEGFQDMVNFYNEQVKKWEDQLGENERDKVEAINDRTKRLIKNHSLSAGTSITESTSKTGTHDHVHSDSDGFNFQVGIESGYGTESVGIEYTAKTFHQFNWTDDDGDTKDSTETYAYTLADNDYADYLTVDVLKSDMGSPIFYTRGGATSCPYEDQDTTRYYQPGTPVSTKTMQIEKPEIEVLNPIITGVPAGGEATVKINVRNHSEVGYKVVYDIKVTPYSNPDGLAVYMDEVSLNRGSSLFVKPDETMVKTLTVRQTDPNVLNYENITLRLASQCQTDPQIPRGEIADYATFSVYFQPTCSDIKLESSHTLVNSDTEEPVTLSMSGYNYSMATLQGIRLQYKAENDADFRTLQEYTKDESRLAADHNLLPLVPLEGTSKLNYVLDLRTSDFSDKTYVFRAVTVCDQGGKEVTNESPEIRIVRNISRPQLIATPSPANGILTAADDLLITFNEAIQGSDLTKPNNFDVVGILNEGEVAHDVALNLSDASTAKTDATLNLDGSSFSISMWLKYNANGTLLTHGTADHPFILAIESEYLTATVAGTKVTSVAQLPVDKWIYLLVSYNAENATLNAGYAQDDFTVILMDNASAAAYNGNGNLTLGGNGIEAQVQELVIWSGTRSMAEAQSTMYTAKSRYTHGLLGYWPMSEGHGAMATDIARARHLSLASPNGWWKDGENYALNLDGAHAASINIGALNTAEGEDYLIETWFRADKTQAGTASVFATDLMDLRLDEHGCLEILLDESHMELLHRDLRDGQWHHLALNVLKSTNGSGIIYLDGEPCKQLVASAIPVLHGSGLTIGQGLKGAVDEIRIWKARRTADVIKNGRFARLMGNEAGLAAYYPFERFSRDEYNQIITSSSLSDILSENTVGAEGLTLSTLNAVPLNPAPKVENVQFSFVPGERQIRITIDEQPAKIDGCNISITAKRVKDLYGNEAQPVTWSVYVQQNTLNWISSELSVTKTGVESTAFTAAIENRGSQSEAWSISGMPIWLTANVEGGSLAPLASATLTFTVAEDLPIGTYETDIYLSGSQNIATPLHIIVTSEGETPEWTVTPGEETMTIVGVLNINGIQSSDTKDIIAAFRGTECVGLAHPQYFSRYDSYMVLMSVYGKTQAALTYKIYDASTGTVYPSVSVSNEAAYTFGVDKTLGTFVNPVVFTPLNEIEQDLSHDRASWKWFSLYAQPKVNTPAAVFSNAQDAVKVLTDGTNSLMNWMGSLQSFSYDKMYKLEATAPYVETLVGEPVDPTAVDVTLNANGWTWIGYPAQATNSLDAAFAGAGPLDGDMVKSQSAFAIYTQGEWIGSLRTMQPGEGYMYQSNAAADKTFRYPKPVTNDRVNIVARKDADYMTENINANRDNMTMIAVVKENGEIVDNAQISVYAGEERRGFSAQPVHDGRHFITIGGAQGEEENLSFIVTLPDGRMAWVPVRYTFNADAHYGSMAEPVLLVIGSTQDKETHNADADAKAVKTLLNGILYILRPNGTIYNATGVRVK